MGTMSSGTQQSLPEKLILKTNYHFPLWYGLQKYDVGDESKLGSIRLLPCITSFHILPWEEAVKDGHGMQICDASYLYGIGSHRFEEQKVTNRLAITSLSWEEEYNNANSGAYLKPGIFREGVSSLQRVECGAVPFFVIDKNDYAGAKSASESNRVLWTADVGQIADALYLLPIPPAFKFLLSKEDEKHFKQVGEKLFIEEFLKRVQDISTNRLKFTK